MIVNNGKIKRLERSLMTVAILKKMNKLQFVFQILNFHRFKSIRTQTVIFGIVSKVIRPNNQIKLILVTTTVKLKV